MYSRKYILKNAQYEEYKNPLKMLQFPAKQTIFVLKLCVVRESAHERETEREGDRERGERERIVFFFSERMVE